MKELTHEERQKITWQLAAGHDLEDIMDTHPDASVYIIYESAENPRGVKVLDYFWTVEEMDRERPRTFPDTNSWEYERVPFFVAQELTGADKSFMYRRLEESVVDIYHETWKDFTTLAELFYDTEDRIDITKYPQTIGVHYMVEEWIRSLVINPKETYLTCRPVGEDFFEFLCILENSYFHKPKNGTCRLH